MYILNFYVALCEEIEAANITLTSVNKRALNLSRKNEELNAPVVIKKCFPIGYDDNAVMFWENSILAC